MTIFNSIKFLCYTSIDTYIAKKLKFYLFEIDYIKSIIVIILLVI